MRRKFISRMTSFGLSAALACTAASFSVFDTAAADSPDIMNFTLADVTMTDEYCTNAFDKELKYLLSFDNDRLLSGFRENAGLNTKGAKRYGGWENTNIAGHAVGHYLTALAQAYLHPELSDSQ